MSEIFKDLIVLQNYKDEMIDFFDNVDEAYLQEKEKKVVEEN